MARVFVVQCPALKDPATRQWTDKYDLTPAEHFGELIEVLPRGNVPRDLGPTFRALRSALGDFGRLDHLLAVGDPIAIAAAVLVVRSVWNGPISLLKWDKRAQCYRSYVLDLDLDLN